MKLLMVLVGTPLSKEQPKDDRSYLYRKNLYDGEYYYYSEHGIINSDSQMQRLMEAGMDVSYGFVENKKSIKHFIWLAKQIRKTIKEENITTVHVMWGAALGLAVALANPVQTVLSLCGSDLLGNYNEKLEKRFTGRVASILSQAAALLSDKVITKSQDMKNRLWGISRKKAFVLPNGVDPARFYIIDKMEARKILGWDLYKPTVIFFYQPRQFVKNEALAHATIIKLKEQMPGCEYKQLFNIPHGQLVYYYNAADVMLLTSKHEGSNNSLKEALCCNLPVVSTNSGDARERLENVKNCYISTNWDVPELAEDLVNVLNKKERSDGRSHISEITQTAITSRLIEIYKST